MGFQQGLSGLDGSSKALDAIGNNIANANTVGFKQSAAQFSDVYAASLGGGGGSQIGIGANLSTVSQQFTQGNITTTNNPLDVAINGSGMFRLSNNGAITYTRSGQFQLDKNGFVVNAAGLEVTGYAADPITGTIIPGNMTPLKVNNTNIAPQVTKTSQIQVNEDSRATPPSAMSSGTLTGSTFLAASTVITTGTNDTLTVTVDSVPVSITIPAGSYSPGTLVTTVQSLLNAQLAASGAGVTVSTDTNGAMLITSTSKGTVGSQGQGSSVALTGTGGNAVTGAGAIAGLAGALSVAGADNFNPTTNGYATGSLNLTTPVTITLGVNDQLNVTIDGRAVPAVTLTAGGYTPATLAAEVQKQINNGLAALVGPTTNSRVTASVNASGQLVITSNTQPAVGPPAVASTVAATGGTSVATILGVPTSTPGVVNTASVNSLGFTASTAQTVYDSLGNGHNLALYFVKTSLGNTWQLYTTMDGAQQTGPQKLQFNGAGALTTAMPLNLPASGSSYIFANGANPLQFTLDLSGSTQYGIASGVNQLTQDGYTSGRLSGISVSPDGTLLGSYSNGKTKNMGQMVLVSFNNPNGLASLGGNQWAETSESGQPIPGTPGQGSLGALQSASVEDSNVDLTKELVSMITQQRNYQANAQTIKTQDSIMQTLVNLG